MSGISWNCRGLGNQPTVKELKKILNQKKPIVVFLMETRLTTLELTSIKQSLNYEHMHSVDCDLSHGGRRGGLCLFWQDSLEIDILSYSLHHIDASVRCLTHLKEWRLTCIHGWAENHNKPRTWELIREIGANRTQAWLCMGDLNEIMFNHEKMGGAAREQAKMAAFREAMDVSNLEDLGYSGQHFTWSNGQSDTSNIQECLDKALANQEWNLLYPSAKVEHLMRFQSDHSPIWINWKPLARSRRRRPKPKRFEAMWLQESTCGERVKEIWSTSGNGVSPQAFNRKMEMFISSMKEWEKQSVENVISQVADVRAQLEQVQQETPSSELNLNLFLLIKAIQRSSTKGLKSIFQTKLH